MGKIPGQPEKGRIVSIQFSFIYLLVGQSMLQRNASPMECTVAIPNISVLIGLCKGRVEVSENRGNRMRNCTFYLSVYRIRRAFSAKSVEIHQASFYCSTKIQLFFPLAPTADDSRHSTCLWLSQVPRIMLAPNKPGMLR